MQKLNLPDYDFRIVTEGERTMIFDIFRKKFVALTPEEHVRQHFARFLVEERNYPVSLMMTEYSLMLNNMSRRCDIIMFERSGAARALVECKAPTVKINQAVFDQVARYNLVFRVEYLFVTNGLQHYCCKINFETGEIIFLPDVPTYDSLLTS